MGSLFVMSSSKLLDDARTALSIEGISSRRAPQPASATTGPYLAVHHADALLDQVRAIVRDADAFAVQR
jgi:hypothetical protein